MTSITMSRLTPRTAYDAGTSNGHRAGSAGRMYWRDGQPQVTDDEVKADALESFAIMATEPWTPFEEALPVIRAREDIRQLVGEYARGFEGARRAAVEADAAGREVDRSYYQPPEAITGSEAAGEH